MYTVLVISCHPDDVEIACAGTLLKCKERGDRVVVCHLCSGDKGHEIIMPKELAEMRAKEAINGGSLGGFEVMHGGFDDLEIYDGNKESHDKVVNIIRKVNPDFIITHDPEDYMPDHNAVSKLVFDAFNPTEYVDVTEHIDKKLEMLECHESQIVWMREHDHIDFPDMVRTCCRYRGFQCGAEYAEGFRQCQVYLKGTTKRLLP